MMGRWWISQLLLLLIPLTSAEAQFTGSIDRDVPGPVNHRPRLPKGTEGYVLGLPFTIGFSDGHDFVSGDTVDIHWFPQFVPNPPHLVARGGVVKNTSDFAIDFASVPAFEGDFGLPKDLQDVVVSRQGDHGKMGGNLVDVRMLFTIAEAQFTGKDFRDASGLVIHTFRIPAGLVTVNLNSVGRFLFTDGHDFSVADVVDIHWEVDGEPRSNRGRIVKTVFFNEVNLTINPVGEGDTPIPQGIPVIVSHQFVVTTVVDPTTMVSVHAGGSRKSVMDFRDDVDASLFLADFSSESSALFWMDDFGSVNPLLGGGILSEVLVSSASTKFVDFFIIIQYDSVQ